MHSPSSSLRAKRHAYRYASHLFDGFAQARAIVSMGDAISELARSPLFPPSREDVTLDKSEDDIGDIC